VALLNLNPNLQTWLTYLHYISPLVTSQHQVAAIHFYLSSAFYLVQPFIILQKLGTFGLSSGFVSWFHNYLTNCQSFVSIMNISSINQFILSLFTSCIGYVSISPFPVLSRVP
jgi:hypothetical protein